jgi:hypothetical protein
MILDGSNGVTFNDASLQGAAASPYVLKNRIINGDMVINQRGFNGAVGNQTYTLDRWVCDREGGAATATVSQSSTAPTGFINSLLYTVGTGAATGATDYSNVRQYIEGLNVSDLAWGTASAKTVTLSFWVRSSVTGTYGVAFANSGYNRSYIASYTISSANTWEQKTVTIAGDTSGTWLTTNGAGIRVIFDLGVGSTYSGAAGSWTSSLLFGLTGGVKLTVTSGATWYVTGVQLEQNTSATPFERRLYGQELINCQRYFQYGNVAFEYSGTRYASNAILFAPNMRTTPTVISTIGTPTQSLIVGITYQAVAGPANQGMNVTAEGTSPYTSRQYYYGQFSANAEI